MHRKNVTTLASCIVLLLIIIIPVHAPPAFTTGSNANYHLSATAQFKTQCTTVPSQYADQACASGTQSVRHVSILDDGACTPNDPQCTYSPSSITVPTGSVVTWQNLGTIDHTVTGNTTLNGNLNPAFGSSTISPGASYSYTFIEHGVYYYYCMIHQWMKGLVRVLDNATFPVSTPATTNPLNLRAILDGTIGWNAIGVDNSNAVMNVNHHLSLSISPATGLSITPLTESGDSPQAIDLDTRQVTAGTSSGIIERLLRTLYTYGYSSNALAGSPSFYRFLDQNQKTYTFWWVNGPLTSGSAETILTGTSSVTGSTSVSTNTGARESWILSSNWDESLNVSLPTISQSGFSSSLQISWMYDKKSDLLLKAETSGLIDSLSTSQLSIYANPCGPYFTCYTQVPVSVTRETSGTLNLSIQITSTNLNLDNRFRGVLAPGQDSVLTPLTSLSWLSVGVVSAGAAAVVGLGVWLILRRRTQTTGNTQLSGPTLTAGT